ncbi:GGDEF domain-containing phosphodiesterase [Leucobacter allii]|uniref:GGDEF domain-containing phosphodiesterase n=1 Tax=Leucobacter allii TaxID=2932247 RepID=A0ABY4FPV9_9MICO|nr:GGDEF domain-containing phosphodiesterase [Leucobacter allii]UOQ58287.1 GGDEF domain-containing phosphodiesterase [Leucobacter allii]
MSDRGDASPAVHGLADRGSMLCAIEEAASRTTAEGYGAFICVSVDDLSAVNDAFGYEAGDILIDAAAERLRAISIPGVRLGRIGVETFGVLAGALGTDRARAERRCRELVDAVSAALTGKADLGSGVPIELSASIGFVIWTLPAFPRSAHGADAAGFIDAAYLRTADAFEIMKCADIARKRIVASETTKRARRFLPYMLEEAQERVHLISELRRGIRAGELRLYAQPIVDAERRLIGEEGLIRWLSPERGLVPPDSFIPLAEQTDVIVEIGEWVLEEACRILAEWSRDPRFRDVTFSVNLSARQLRTKDFAERLRELVSTHGVPAERLKLELTESVLQSDLESTIRMLTLLRADGILASLDDFGTGYSSLSYLHQLPVQQLKIDRSFVTTVAEDRQAAAIARTIVELGTTLGLQVVAEGVETEAQFAELRRIGVDAFQGYLFGKPRPVEELAAV